MVGSAGAMPTDEAAVTVPARLHLGFLDLNGGLGRRFGSIGVSVGGPVTRLVFRRGRHSSVEGPEAERVHRHLDVMRDFLGLGGGFDIRVDSVVPSHAGLGSGTHLALATAVGLRRLCGLPLDIAGDAVRLGRGARSGVGIGLFARGGVVVDGGRGPGGKVAPVISRIAFPERWRIILVLDPARHGLNGTGEVKAFTALPPAPPEQAAHLCRLVVMQALPSLVDADLEGFGAAIKEIQAAVGDYFAPAQGGRFSSPQVAAALGLLERHGGHGIGQSSWGPTGFAFAASAEEGERLADTLRGSPEGRGLDIRVCVGLNAGAEITAHAPADAPVR
jgi:beta-RFAP synthase